MLAFIRAQFRRVFQKKVNLTITLYLGYGCESLVYHEYRYRGTVDEMMTMLNHVPQIGTTLGDARLNACHVEVKE